MYSRFKALEEYSSDGLEKLQDSRVAVVGLGATGSAIAENLARHGVELLLIDRDYLEPNDCYSSSLYTPDKCEKSLPKAEVARERLEPFTEVRAKTLSLHKSNTDVLEGVDLVMDGTDNMAARRLIADFSENNDVPWIYTAALGEKGYSMLFDEKCFGCVFEDVDPGSLETCESAGIMREVAAVAAARSSHKAVRYLTSQDVEEVLEEVTAGRELEVTDSGSCRICDDEREFRPSGSAGSVCGENKFEIRADVDEEAFDSLKSTADSWTENDYLLRAELESGSFVLFRSGRAIVEARDRGHAEQLFSEHVGI